MTPFDAFKEDFKVFEPRLVLNSRGEIVRKLLTPNQIKTLVRENSKINRRLNVSV